MDQNSNEEKKCESCDEKKEATLQKICLVCGDKALGYNFNAISCESCKAFFRRNALTNKEFKCPFANNCEITMVTRRFCQKCRLQKCFTVGMVKEFIMSDVDKAEKRKKIEENRAKKRQLNVSDDSVSSSKTFKSDDEASQRYQQVAVQYNVLNSTTSSPQSTVETIQSPPSAEFDPSISRSPPIYYPSLQSTESYMMQVFPMEEKAEDKDPNEQRGAELYNMCDSMMDGYELGTKQTNSIRQTLSSPAAAPPLDSPLPVPRAPSPRPSTSTDENRAREILQDVESIVPNSMESILCEAIKIEFAGYNACNDSSSGELNEVEQAKLNELIVANKALNAPIDDDISQLIGEGPQALKSDGRHDPLLITIVNLTAIAIRRFIKMAKKITAFRNMCEEDQVSLLKGGCIEMLVLRSTMNYDGQGDHWRLPHIQNQFGTIRTDVLKLAKGDIYNIYDAYIKSFRAAWRKDERMMLCVLAVLLFSARPSTVHADVVSLHQNSYYYLLRRYLESIYPGCEAKSTFLKLIQKVLEIRKLAAEVTDVYLDVNPIEPLLMEIFDLKHHAA